MAASPFPSLWDTKEPSLRELQAECHNIAVSKGFYSNEPANRRDPIWNLARIMLMVTELAEAAEDVRKDRWEHLGEEFADVIIRIMDTSQYLGIDLTDEIRAKMETNRRRPYMHGKNS